MALDVLLDHFAEQAVEGSAATGDAMHDLLAIGLALECALDRVDLTADAGRDAFHRMAAVSHVVIDGMRPGVMHKLGIDYEALSQINPGIISLSLSA